MACGMVLRAVAIFERFPRALPDDIEPARGPHIDKVRLESRYTQTLCSGRPERYAFPVKDGKSLHEICHGEGPA